ncbi:MAG: dihydropteroate synthase [Proteobacteria bacterium]|nr:dihydropteroate synthase [Pseudomonadota bacterium]
MRRPRLLEPGPDGIRAEMSRMGVDPGGIGIMEEKGRLLLVRLDDVDLKAALILKQDMLSIGGDVALCRKAASLEIKKTPALIVGTVGQIRKLSEKIRQQGFGSLRDLGGGLADLLSGLGSPPSFLVDGRDLLEGGRVLVMGVLNVTPDSFYDGGHFEDPDAAVARGLRMTEEGADIIDVGGESTRPGSRPVQEDEEVRRVLPVIRGLRAGGVKYISIDTTRALVARKAVSEGANIVNDISGMHFDPSIRGVCAETGASAVLMHTRGQPETMQERTDYQDLMGEVCSFLEDSMDRAVGEGIPPERICVDPGIGFGKTVRQNIEIIARLGELRSLGRAVMVGVSRKSFIGKISGADVGERLYGSLAAASAAVLKGADIVRVHDVAETVQAMSVIREIRGTARC